MRWVYQSYFFVLLTVKEKLNEDADCEIATTMLKVSLVCPLGKMRMATPCRYLQSDAINRSLLLMYFFHLLQIIDMLAFAVL